MTETFAKVKNWAEFQHYKDRNPPWIKLHRGFLDDYDFACLPIASKALAPLLWLLAAESKDGSVRIDEDFLAFRLRWNIDDVRAAVTPLIEKGFLICASAALAKRSQVAIPETETETETEKKRTRGKRAQTPLPENFAVSDRVKTWAAGKGFDRLDDHLESFRAKCQAKGYAYADWDSAFMEAIREDWAKLRQMNGANGHAPPVVGTPRQRRELGT